MSENLYDYSKYNQRNPFVLHLTGDELKSLMDLLEAEWCEKESLNSELQSVRADLRSFMTTFNRKTEKV